MVEAAVLFPIVVLIFAGLVLLSVYLPARASLQRSTQMAATALAAEMGDTWLFFDENSLKYYWASDRSELGGIYAAAVFGGDGADRAEIIVKKTEEGGFAPNFGDLSVECSIVNQVLYQEITVTAKREIMIPVDLSFVGFPKHIELEVSSTAVVQNGDEFVRTMGLAAEFAAYISEKYGINDLNVGIGDSINQVAPFMGWK